MRYRSENDSGLATGRRFENVEITPEMIQAGVDVYAQNMTALEVCTVSPEDFCAMVFQAMTLAAMPS